MWNLMLDLVCKYVNMPFGSALLSTFAQTEQPGSAREGWHSQSDASILDIWTEMELSQSGPHMFYGT
jgi:hypothetical protein